MPMAQNAPEARGSRARLQPSARATAAPCIGPAPPAATRVKVAGLWPRSMESRSTACSRFCSSSRITPDAAASTGKPSGLASLVSTASPRQAAVERDRAAGQRAGPQAPEHELRIGDGRLLAAEAIGGRTGPRAGALWADMQQARIVDPGDRAAARADGVDLDRRRGEVIAVDRELVGDRHLAAGHHHHVAARAADLHRDQVGRLARRRAALERADAGGRARQHQHHRPRRDLLDRDRAAVALQQQQRARQAELAQLAVERREVARDLGRDIGVHHGGRAALVLAHGRHDLARQRDPLARAVARQLRARRALVRAVEEGVEQAHRDQLDALRREQLGRCGDILRDERRQLAPVRAEAAAHRQAQVARHQHLGERRAMVPLVLAHAAADLERIAEALGGQHAHLRALLLEDGVGGDGRAVHEQRAVAQQRGQRQVELLGGQPQHAQHAFAGIGRHRRRLEDAHRAGRIAQHHVGEGAADIDADAPGSGEGGSV